MAIRCTFRVRGANAELVFRRLPEHPAVGDCIEIDGSSYEVLGVHPMVEPPNTPELAVDLRRADG